MQVTGAVLPELVQKMQPDQASQMSVTCTYGCVCVPAEITTVFGMHSFSDNTSSLIKELLYRCHTVTFDCYRVRSKINF